MYSQTTGDDNHGQPIKDNTDHLPKDFWKYQVDNAEYNFFPMDAIFPPATQHLNRWIYFTYNECMCKYVFLHHAHHPSLHILFSLSISFISHTSSLPSCLTWMYVYVMCFLTVKCYFCHQSHKKKKKSRVLKTPWTMEREELTKLMSNYVILLMNLHRFQKKKLLWLLTIRLLKENPGREYMYLNKPE